MRKLLVALMIVAFAATAFAEVSISGYYNVNGIYQQNLANVDDNSDDANMFYEQEFKLWVNAQTDKDTYFKSKLEIADNTWAESGASTSYGSETTHFQVERAWMSHNFGVLKLDVGLMDGSAWSYAFGNNVEGYYRVKATIPAGPGNAFVIAQKNSEQNGNEVDQKDAEKDDSDTYYLAYSGKFGGITVAPLFGYAQVGNTQPDDADMDTTITLFDLGLGGSFGAVGFEAEFQIKKTDLEQGEDPTVWGAFANIYGKVAGAKVGFITAYSAYDKDTNQAFDMADDFDDDIAFVLGEEGYLGTMGLSGSYSGLGGIWLNGVYADYSVNDKLGLSVAGLYAVSTISDSEVAASEAYEDASAYEFDLTVNYAITKELAYKVMFGYAQADLDGSDDPDAAIYLMHGLTLSF